MLRGRTDPCLIAQKLYARAVGLKISVRSGRTAKNSAGGGPCGKKIREGHPVPRKTAPRSPCTPMLRADKMPHVKLPHPPLETQQYDTKGQGWVIPTLSPIARNTFSKNEIDINTELIKGCDAKMKNATIF